MSHIETSTAINWAWDQELRTHEKIVLLSLAMHVDSDYKCFPSGKRLAKLTGQTSDSVYRQISRLEQSGHLTVVERGNAKENKSNTYRLEIPTDSESVGLPTQDRSKYIYTNTKDLDRLRIGRATDSGSVGLPEGFEEFWEAYPRKVAKPAAVRAFKAVKAEKHLQAIVVNLKTRYIATEKKFIPNPSTYLNQRRWEDELDDVPTDVFGNVIMDRGIDW